MRPRSIPTTALSPRFKIPIPIADALHDYLGRMHARGVSHSLAYARLLSAGLRAVSPEPEAPDPILRRPLYQAILDLLGETPGMSTTLIAQRLDLRRAAQARYHLQRLMDQGLVTREGTQRGARYYLAAPATPER